MSEKKAAPFKGREPLSIYEIHSLIIGYTMLGLTVFLAFVLLDMSAAIKTIIG